MTNRERIVTYLQNHPNGVDDDELAKALGLSQRQQANMRCRELEKEGLVIRRPVYGKIHNFWAGKAIPPAASIPEPAETKTPKSQNWFWEGNVQARIVEYLRSEAYAICSTADTASFQRGIDIVATRDGSQLWVSVKGYPAGTERTNPTVQAGHWFKQAVFDMIEYRERDKQVLLALALPDYPRYHRLAKKITWLKPVAKFRYYWATENGQISEE